MTKALDRWAHSGIRTIDLPSGAGKVKVRTLDLTECLSLGRIPNPLRGTAVKAETEIVDETKFTDAERVEWFSFRCWVIADGIAAFKPRRSLRWSPGPDAEWVASEMPPGDRDVIWAHRMHLLSPDDARALMGLLEVENFREGVRGAGPDGGGRENQASA